MEAGGEIKVAQGWGLCFQAAWCFPPSSKRRPELGLPLPQAS